LTSLSTSFMPLPFRPPDYQHHRSLNQVVLLQICLHTSTAQPHRCRLVRHCITLPHIDMSHFHL